MSSVVELEIEGANERKKLMEVFCKYLQESGVEAELTSEKVTTYYDLTINEPVAKIKGRNIDTIRLNGVGSGGCDVPGYILRFQYEIHPEKQIQDEKIGQLTAETRLIKEGKVIGFFGGQVTGVKWEGGGLADKLNQDQGLAASMLKCVKSQDHLEFQIEGSPSAIYIAGPRFVGEEYLKQLYESGLKEELRNCLFGFTIVEKIAEQIKKFVAQG
jgi:hypothetical protein